jgi:hypothetical protein
VARKASKIGSLSKNIMVIKKAENMTLTKTIDIIIESFSWNNPANVKSSLRLHSELK